MAWVLIDPTAVDVNSPIDVDLMDNKIKNNDDDHQARILVLEASGGGGGAAGVDTLETRAPLRHIGGNVVDPPNSVLEAYNDTGKIMLGELLETYVSGTSMKISWNNIFAEDDDPDMDSTANWVLRFSAANLGTSGTAKIGANPISFDKVAGTLEAAIDLDRGSANLALGGHSKVVYVWVNLPSVTNLSTVDLYIKVDTSNYQKFSTAVDHLGANMISGGAGEYLVAFNISTGGVATGAGWDVSKLARFPGLGVTVTGGNSAQTYTQIEFDGLRFQENDITNFIQKGCEVSIYDSSNLENMTIAVAGTGVDGTITLTSGLSNGYTAGAGNNFIKRNVIIANGDNEGKTENGLSGDAADSQAFRLQRTLPASVSSLDFVASIAVVSNIQFRVLEITDATHFTMEDEGAIAVTEVVNGNTLSAHEVVPNPGNAVSFINRNADQAVTAATTNSAGISTVTVTSTTGLAVGDIVFKEVIENIKMSLVTKDGDESFTSMTPTNAQIQLVSRGIAYPHRANVYGHWPLGGATSADATRNLQGVAQNLEEVGTLNKTGEFFNGRFSVSGFSASDYYRIGLPATDTKIISGDIADSTVISFYINLFIGASSGNSTIASKQSIAQGWLWLLNRSSMNLELRQGLTGTIHLILPFTNDNKWHSLAFRIEDTVRWTMWMDNVKTTKASVDVGDSNAIFTIGIRSDLGEPLRPQDRLADGFIEVNGPGFSDENISELHNGGNPRIVGDDATNLIIRPRLTNQSGQKLSLRGDVTRETDASSIAVKWAGIING